jgi:RNA polymerase sigma-70 factor (ECF subfamily)
MSGVPPRDTAPRSDSSRHPSAPSTTRSDADLIAGVQRGDRAAFEAVFRAHYDGLVRFANRLVGTRAVAEELVHDVLLKVWIHRDRLVPGEELKGYLFRATRNHALNHLRRGRIERLWQRQLPPEEPSAPAETSESLSDTEAAVRAAIAALPDRCREVFLLSREQGLSYSAIAATMGISIKTVETQMGRALKALRAALAPYR